MTGLPLLHGPSTPTSDPTWYKDAVIYEIRTRSFFDSNGDGVGDFQGLTSKLDYLQDLGVTAIWLLPFYPSPGRDDGYDISDYTGVHPEVGTLADFELLLDEAHRRGIKVITELVLNHTSDQHPWFKRARHAPAGSVERDFYVWGDSINRYADARIIFKDFEESNWSWDREAKAYYWHRFYAHQPDLNFENPAVHEALFEAVDFWLNKGVDGLRLDAVPYLYEADGTNCENLPQTHSFLRKLRAHIDSKFSNRMLLAEANQWPEDAAAYFGRGDECHMNFHFPLMPRMFMALHQEDRFPIIDIFAQTPDVHETCQWALFLRNHDELTLEMVTDDERDYMYRAYADQPAMRINLGIRRRLAPLVGNSRRKIELLNGLLFSLPGTPVIYYGDEIGMGDNVYLGDRNGVRTPMQWSLDRNAGFSRANPQRLILPVIIDPEYHYESLNVENQQQNPTSLLWWTKRLVALRKRYVAFGRGSIEFLSPDNSRVLAFLRSYGAETTLVVANLSRFPQFAAIDLARHKGAFPVELFGRTEFPAIGDGPYPLTLGPHGFYWFSLERRQTNDPRVAGAAAPTVVECTSLDALLLGKERGLFGEVLPAFLERREWFAGRRRTLRSVRVTEAIPLGTPSMWLVVARAEYADGSAEHYALPIAWMPGPSQTTRGEAVVCFVRFQGSPSGPTGAENDSTDGVLVDALDDTTAARVLLYAIAGAQRFESPGAELVASSLQRIETLERELPSEQTLVKEGRDHTTIRFGDRWMLRVLRRLDEGTSPALEVGRYLALCGSHVGAPLLGSIELTRPRVEPVTVAMLHAYVAHENTAWDLTLEELRRFYDRALARPASALCPPPPFESPLLLGGREPPALVAEMMGGYRVTAARLGACVAQLHLTLAKNVGDPAFAPEPYSSLGTRAKYQSLRTLCGKVFRTLRERMGSLTPDTQREARAILENERHIIASFEPLLRASMTGSRIRGHGKLDLRHVLCTGKDFVLTDFHGHEPLSLAERRRKRSPLRDLASLARSFELAAYTLLFDPLHVREGDVDAARPWAMHWSSWAAASLLEAYLAATSGADFVPKDREVLAIHFDTLVVERALYQLRGALEEPVPPVRIPLMGIARLLQTMPNTTK